MNKQMLAVVVAAVAAGGFAGAVPKSVTKGAATTVPSFEGMPFEKAGEPQAIAIPNVGWKIDYQRGCPPGKDFKPGLKVEPTEVELRGKKVPAIRITCTSHPRGGGFPLVALPFEIDFTDWNVLSFAAKIECPEGVSPTIGDSTPMIGWFPQTFNGLWDDFGISGDDGVAYPWAGNWVSVTDFKNHDYPKTRTADGFTEFRWDVLHEERTSYKGFVHDHIRSLYFMYDCTKLWDAAAGKSRTVVITIADMKLVKGYHYRFDEPERYAKWLKRVEEYRPDYSDSSKYLEPPEEGRLGFFSKVRLAKGGKACAEIVVDMSDEILLDRNFAPERMKQQEIMQTRGSEFLQARKAAYELQHWLKEVTGGAEFPVVTKPTDADGAKIFLGAGFAKKYFADDLAKLAANRAIDGYAVRVKGGDVYIFGAHPMGTMNGVYAFLENNTDIIWAAMDDPDGTIFTPDPDLTCVWGDAIDLPVFIVRGWQGGSGDWRRQNRSNFPVGGGYDGYLQMEYGYMLHGGHYLSPQYYEYSEGMQADFNPVFDGVRQRNWNEHSMLCCLANPEFPKHAFTCLPCVQEMANGGSFNMVFGTDDNFGVCQCKDCTAPIKTLDGRMLTPDVDYQAYYCAWFYTYLNKMDDEIQKVCPGFMTSTYAYFFACSYPPIKVNKTIVPWLCAYYRKDYNEPIYAPANQNWWKIYRDWAKHTDGLYLYDYYGLGLEDAPLAEVYQEDLKAQRDIGFLRTSTEGAGHNQYMGCGDERWVMTRLAWNPDADVEQLHRYYNRRVYREAAPWIDRFRGTIRANWYRNYKTHMQLNENLECACMIRMLDLDGELTGYLDEAMKAVRNPKAKSMLEKLVADYRWAIANKACEDTWSFPSDKLVAKAPKAKPAETAADKLFKERIGGVSRLSKAGKHAEAKDALAVAMADRLVSPKLRIEKLQDAVCQLVVDSRAFGGREALESYRKLLDENFLRATGASGVMNYPYQRIPEAIAGAFLQIGQPKEAVAVFDAYLRYEGHELTPGAQKARWDRMIDFLRSRGVDVTPRLGDYLAAQRECASSAGCTMSSRGDAKLRLYAEAKAKMTVDERVKALFEIIDDRFMLHATREKATRLLAEACAADGKTDWPRVAAETLKALAAGDWSSLRRNTYFQGTDNDHRLNVLVDVADALAKAERADLAKDLLVKGAKTLGYAKGATALAADGVDNPGFAARVKKLDAALAKHGLSRPE